VCEWGGGACGRTRIMVAGAPHLHQPAKCDGRGTFVERRGNSLHRRVAEHRSDSQRGIACPPRPRGHTHARARRPPQQPGLSLPSTGGRRAQDQQQLQHQLIDPVCLRCVVLACIAAEGADGHHDARTRHGDVVAGTLGEQCFVVQADVVLKLVHGWGDRTRQRKELRQMPGHEVRDTDGPDHPPCTQRLQRTPRLHALQSKRLLIGSRWVSKPLAFAGKLRPRRLNN
jgi:hypothetical protein